MAVTPHPAMQTLIVLLRTIRAPFLILTPVCVLLGASTAFAVNPAVDAGRLTVVLVGALLAHISVNMLNEYQDFGSGLDFNTRQTPFSGGSGALPASPEAARWVLLGALAALVATLLIGLGLLRSSGFGLVPIGVVGAILIVTYTEGINRYPLLCLIAPGLGFGVLMVLGTHFVLAGGYSITAWMAAAVSFFLVNNLLLLNQYPDIVADAAVGRKHFPIAYGVRVSNIAYGLTAAAAVIAIVVGVAGGFFPVQGLVALVPMPLALYALIGARKHGRDIGQFPKYLAANVAVSVLVPLLLAASILIG